MFGEGFDSHEGVAFSDEEILVFISKIDFSIELSNDGWRVLLGRIASFVSDDDGFVSAALKNGDIERLAGVMNNLTRLITSVQSHLTVREVGLLRGGDREKFAEAVFGMFGDKEWELFSSVASLALCVDEYEVLCEERYGDDFAQYKESLSPLSFDEFKSAVGEGDFYESLERYVYGISPAFSYGMRK